MKETATFFLILLYVGTVFGQKFAANKSEITFYSYAPIEDIQASNTKSRSFINLTNGDLVFSVPIKGFIFEKALMQEHFNENYMESYKYPNATFIGRIDEWEKFEGSQRVKASGNLSIHGIKREVKLIGQMIIQNDAVIIDSKFDVKVEDHGIKIPSAVFYNIAENIQVDVHFEYKPYKSAND